MQFFSHPRHFSRTTNKRLVSFSTGCRIFITERLFSFRWILPGVRYGASIFVLASRCWSSRSKYFWWITCKMWLVWSIYSESLKCNLKNRKHIEILTTEFKGNFFLICSSVEILFWKLLILCKHAPKLPSTKYFATAEFKQLFVMFQFFLLANIVLIGVLVYLAFRDFKASGFSINVTTEPSATTTATRTDVEVPPANDPATPYSQYWASAEAVALLPATNS